MLMQNFGATIKKHYGMLWYFLEWPIKWWNNSFAALYELTKCVTIELMSLVNSLTVP